VGQVYIKTDHAKSDTPVAVFQTSRAWASKPRQALRIGDQVQLHDRAVILGRFIVVSRG